MRHSLQSMVVVVAFMALLGCGTTPVAPTQASSREFDPDRPIRQARWPIHPDSRG